MKKIFILLTLVLSIFGCTKKQTPETQLRDFVQYRFDSKQTRGKLLSFLSGSLHKLINEMSDKEFEHFTKNIKYKKKKFRVVLKKCDDTKCFITYILAYTQPAPNNPDYEVEVKKIAELENGESGWKITNVNNVKSYIEALKPLEVPL